MSIFASPAEHAAHPPSSWTVRKHGRKWGLFIGNEHPADTFLTKRQAEAAKTTGFLADLYAKELRWYAGEAVYGWKPYAVCLAERLRNDARAKNSQNIA